MRFRKLRELRVLNELTQTDLAKILNCTQQSLSAYEKGLRDVPVDVLIKYAGYKKPLNFFDKVKIKCKLILKKLIKK